jgi:hypothetical protein
MVFAISSQILNTVGCINLPHETTARPCGSISFADVDRNNRSPVTRSRRVADALPISSATATQARESYPQSLAWQHRLYLLSTISLGSFSLPRFLTRTVERTQPRRCAVSSERSPTGMPPGTLGPPTARRDGALRSARCLYRSCAVPLDPTQPCTLYQP